MAASLPATEAGLSSTVKTDSRPVTCKTFLIAGRGLASERSPPASRARRCAASSTFIPVESQNSTPAMSTTSCTGVLAASALVSSEWSLGAV